MVATLWMNSLQRGGELFNEAVVQKSFPNFFETLKIKI
jgi:5-enolpyruvylshikimate-3-phosphate synthase